MSTTPRLSVQPLLLESEPLTAIMTRQTTLRFTGLQWVSSFMLFLFHFSSNLFFQFSTLITNYTISRRLDGRKIGLKLCETLSMPSSIIRMHLWMLTSMTLTLSLYKPLCIFFYILQNVWLTFPSAFVVLIWKHLQWVAGTFCPPKIQPSWWVGSLSQHRSQACHWCSCLVVREAGCVSSPPSYGIGLLNHSGWVPFILIPVLLIDNWYFN